MRLFKALIKISLTTETKVYVLVRLDFVSGSFKCHDLLCVIKAWGTTIAMRALWSCNSCHYHECHSVGCKGVLGWWKLPPAALFLNLFAYIWQTAGRRTTRTSHIWKGHLLRQAKFHLAEPIVLHMCYRLKPIYFCLPSRETEMEMNKFIWSKVEPLSQICHVWGRALCARVRVFVGVKELLK